MPAGLQVFNNDSIIQIDGAYSNLQLTLKGSASSTMQTLGYQTNPNGTYFRDTPIAYVTFSGATPVFALSGPSTASVVSTSVSGSQWTVGVVTPGGPASFDWFVFDKAAPFSSNSGLQVFNDSSVLVFDAYAKYMKVIGNVLDLVPTFAINGVNGYTSPFTNTYSFPGKTTAIGCMFTPVNSGTTKWPSGTSTIPSSPNCQGFGFGGWRGVNGAAYFDFVHTILSYQGYIDGGATGQAFPYSAAADDSSFVFGVRQYGGLILDVTNY